MSPIRQRRRLTAVAVLILCGVFMLTACSDQSADTEPTSTDAPKAAPSYAVFDRAVAESDELPSGLQAHATESADETTARYVGAFGATKLWLMRGEDPSNVCLLAYLTEEEWIAGCGGEAGPIGVSGDAGHFTVIPDGETHPDGATQISENVFSY